MATPNLIPQLADFEKMCGKGISNGPSKVFNVAPPAAQPSKKRSFYDILGVPRDASQDAVKKAYQRLALQYHPDRNPGSEEQARVLFQEVSEAYETISDPTKRAEYDRFGHLKIVTISKNDIINTFSTFFRESSMIPSPLATSSSTTSNPTPTYSIYNSFFNASDPLTQFEGKFNSHKKPRFSKQKQMKRGLNIQTTLVITFQESVKGCKKTIDVNKIAFCDLCDGTGWTWTSKDRALQQSCETCHGEGTLMQESRIGSLKITCPSCFGSGEATGVCAKCKGDGKMNTIKVVAVDVPAGVVQGTKRVIQEEGEAGDKGAPCGDLVVSFEVEAHPFFRREVDNVICDFTVSFSQAALGSRVTIPSIYGNIEIDIPQGTQPGDILRIPNQGFVNSKDSTRGDMFLKLNVQIPKVLTEQQKQLLLAFVETEKVSLPTKKITAI